MQRCLAVPVLVIGILTVWSCTNREAAPPPSASVLIDAATRGDSRQVEQLLAAGVPIDGRGGGQRTALLAAVGAGHDDVALLLVRRGASINAQADDLDTPWLLAGALGRATVLAEMLAHGPDLTIRNRFGGNALIPACERAHVEAVRVLLKSKIDLDHVNNLGWTCLLEIVILGSGGPRHQEVARLVLDAGANPNLADRDGVTPLEHARRRGQTDVAALIRAAGGR